jgi:hypothetical protein
MGIQENPLDLVSTDDLIEELSKRFDHFVMHGLQAGLEGGNAVKFRRTLKGNPYTCVGLCELLKSLAVAQTLSLEGNSTELGSEGG